MPHNFSKLLKMLFLQSEISFHPATSNMEVLLQTSSCSPIFLSSYERVSALFSKITAWIRLEEPESHFDKLAYEYVNSRSSLFPCPHPSRVSRPILYVSGILGHSKRASKLARSLDISRLGNTDSENLQTPPVNLRSLQGPNRWIHFRQSRLSTTG
jgi:hypothetical protein